MLVGSPPPASRAAEAPETIDPDAPCASSECHTEFGKTPYVHWSDFTEPGECESCHEGDDGLHEFTVGDTPDLCTDCHEEIGELIQSAATVHDPAEDCTDCHDPHGGRVEAMLLGVKEDDLKPLCFECHDEDLLAEEYTHGPVDQGECNLCHDPHASSKAALLLAEGVELCGDCHDDIVESIEESEYVHDPVEEGCIDCHNPHSGPYPKMLSARKGQLCNECHDDIVEEATTSAVDHAPVLTEEECVGCHSPHASNHPGNLLKPQPDLCLGCHNKPLESGDSMLTDMQGLLLQNREWHGAILEEDCSGCHQPHGSANHRLLKDRFPPTFYAPFDLDVYGLCFNCHESAAMTVQWTRTLTGFRDGDRNLHFLHVNKEKRGRTCRACHELHAAENSVQIRQEVSYGKWLMPINFTKEETGGSCHPGCHRIKAYDRKSKDYSGD
jgi:predicted CXXCH cytochrome family protein